MTRDDRFDRTVAAWLDERASESRPRYLEDILTTTGRTRQRPAWSSPGRWLPIDALVRPIALAGATRLLVVLALVLALAAVAVLVGSPPELPAPFGEARNGTVVYGDGGDLYAVDLAGGETVPIVAGAAEDETPDFSHDGSRFVFARRANVPGRWLLMVANADGTDVRPLTGPINPTWNVWSPDDTQVLAIDAGGPAPVLTLYNLDGRAPVTLDIAGLVPEFATYRPDGREIVILGRKAGMYGIYGVATTGKAAPRTIVEPVPGSTIITSPTISPDGRTLAYTRWAGDHSVIHLVDLDSVASRPTQLDPTSEGENVAAWSPDGTRLLFHRHAGGSYQLAIAAAGGGSVALLGPVMPQGTAGADAVFSPDGLQVIARYASDGSVWLLDAAGGPGTRLDLETKAAVSWQRLAP